MVFKRRNRRSPLQSLRQFLWPRGGWGRAFRYMRHRVHRIPDTPEKIARGIWAGVFTTFTPFYGLHFVTAALLALMIRGNVLAAVIGTFFGNPLTYLPIGVISLQTGYFLLGRRYRDDLEETLLGKFAGAAQDLWQNFLALFSDRPTNWTGLERFYHDVFFPYMIGGIIPGIVAATICYILALPVIRAYQNRRKGTLARKLAEIGHKTRHPERPAEKGGAGDG